MSHIFGMSLLPPALFFFFGLLGRDPSLCIAEELLVETSFVNLQELSGQPNSILLKYSISCSMRDPTVPLVPTSTGVVFAVIFFGIVKTLVLDLYVAICTVGTGSLEDYSGLKGR